MIIILIYFPLVADMENNGSIGHHIDKRPAQWGELIIWMSNYKYIVKYCILELL